MLRRTYILSFLLLNACNSPLSDKNKPTAEIKTIDCVVKNTIVDEAKSEENDEATYFVLIADTGFNYLVLHQKMIALHSQLKIPIDTMGRSYNEAKELIVLPDNDEDELYAGAYYPRRFPSDNLSLEYLNFYKKQSDEKTIALVTGIYETEKSADSALSIIKELEKKAFIVKAEIYIGCMH